MLLPLQNHKTKGNSDQNAKDTQVTEDTKDTTIRFFHDLSVLSRRFDTSEHLEHAEEVEHLEHLDHWAPDHLGHIGNLRQLGLDGSYMVPT